MLFPVFGFVIALAAIIFGTKMVVDIVKLGTEYCLKMEKLKRGVPLDEAEPEAPGYIDHRSPEERLQ